MVSRAFVQAQRQETHSQNDHHGLDQDLDEFVDRVGYGARLVLHLLQAHAHWQSGLHACDRLAQGLAQSNDVPAFGHGHAQGDDLLTIVAYFDGRWIHISAGHCRDVGQANLCTRSTADGHGLQVFQRLELPTHAHLHHVQRRLHAACRLHRVLLTQLRQHRSHVQTQLHQLLLRHLDKDFFVLRPKQVHFRHIRHAQQGLAQDVCLCLDFGSRETLTTQGIDDAIHIAKFVIEKRPHHTLRQAATHVTDFFTHRIPNLRHFPGLGVVFDLENDLRFTRLGIAADLVRKRHLLKGAFQLVGHLLGHLFCGSTRPISPHDHGPEGERGVFILPQLKIGRHAQNHQHHHQVAGQGRVLQRPAREVESGVVGSTHGITAALLKLLQMRVKQALPQEQRHS